MIFHYTGSLIPECFLFLTQPDWSDGVKVKYSIPSDQSIGLTGLEYRSAAARSMRISGQTFTLQMTAAECDEMRKDLAAIGSKLVGVPLWPDYVSDGWIHAGQFIVAWNTGNTFPIVAASGVDVSSYEFAAPLMLGRFEPPKIKPLGGNLYECELTVAEESPFSCRIEPSSGDMPTVFEWSANLETIEDQSRNSLRFEAVGTGRERGVAGDTTAHRWGQSGRIDFLDRDDIAAFIRFWANQRGSVKSFSAPAWVQPGSATAETPNFYSARFDKDSIEIEYETPRCATCEILLWQELNGTADQFGDTRTYLYKFQWDDDADADAMRYTRFEHALTCDGNTFAPNLVTHEDLRETNTPLGSEVDVTIHESSADNPLMEILQGEAERILTLTIYLAVVSSTGSVSKAEEVFTGTIRTVESGDDKIKGTAYTFGNTFRRRILRNVIQTGCNNSLCDYGCKIARTTAVYAGTLAQSSSLSGPWFTPATQPPAGDYQAEWFARGWLKVTDTTGRKHKRAIVSCIRGDDGVYTLNLNRPLPDSVCDGVSAEVMSGCDGKFATCISKWGNRVNFGGFPYTPEYISTSNGNNQKVGK